MVKGGVDKTLDEGRVARGGCDAKLADSWWGNTDGYFIFLGAVGDDDDDSSGGIIRQRFLFLWANINGFSVGGGSMGGLSVVSASFRHGGMYVASHTRGSSDLLNHKGVVRSGRRGW